MMGGLSFLFIRPSWRLNEHAFCSDTVSDNYWFVRNSHHVLYWIGFQ